MFIEYSPKDQAWKVSLSFYWSDGMSIRYVCWSTLLHIIRNIAGCLNGGGQVRPHEPVTSKKLLDRVEAIYCAVKYVPMYKSLYGIDH